MKAETMANQGFGEQLATARRDAGLTVQQVSDALRIRNDIVRAIEMEDFSSMPAKAFSRNQVSAYARYLGLDSGAIVRDFLDAYSDFERRAAASVDIVVDQQQPSGDRAYVEARRAMREQSENGGRIGNSRSRRQQEEEEELQRQRRQREEESRYTEANSKQRGGLRSGRVRGGSSSGSQRSSSSGKSRQSSSRQGSSSGKNRQGSSSGNSRQSGGSGNGSQQRRRSSGSQSRSSSSSNQRRRSSGSNNGSSYNQQRNRTSSGSRSNSSNAQRNRRSSRDNDVTISKPNRKQREIAQHTGSRSLNDGSESFLDNLLGSLNVSKIVLVVAIVIIALVVIFAVSRCGSNQSETPDLTGNDGSSTVEVTGGSEEVESELTDDQIAAITASPGIDDTITSTGDTFTFTVTLADGATAWTQIDIDGTTEVAESAEGPQEWEFEVTSSAYLQTGYPSSTTVEVNGSEVEIPTSSSGVGTLTVTLGEDGTITTE